MKDKFVPVLDKLYLKFKNVYVKTKSGDYRLVEANELDNLLNLNIDITFYELRPSKIYTASVTSTRSQNMYPYKGHVFLKIECNSNESRQFKVGEI